MLPILSVITLICCCIPLVTPFVTINPNLIGTAIQSRESTYFIHTSNVVASINRESDAFYAGTDQAWKDIELITSVHLSNRRSIVSEYTLKAQLSRFRDLSDDVWNEDFLDGIAIAGSGNFMLDSSAMGWMREERIKTLFLSGTLEATNLEGMDLRNITIVYLSTILPPGPYAVSKNAHAHVVHDVYLLRPDVYEAFMFGMIPNGHGGWIQTNFTFPDLIAPTVNRDFQTPAQYIPIPSRLKSIDVEDDALALSGKRFVVKDIFHMQGVTTTAGSATYAEMNPVSNITAPSIQALVNLGAIPIGKTRTSQFAHGANPWEFRDFAYSWSPRGDGYLTAMSSSSGSACAIAGYEWVDFAVGSDTRGSVRKPASVVGVYGIRPSFGSLSRDGVVPLSEEMDTIGFFARDPELFYDVAKLWYAESPVKAVSDSTSFPRQVLYPYDHFPVKQSAAQFIYDAFVKTLYEHLNLTKIPINITDKVLPYMPDGGFDQFKRSSDILAEYHSWNTVGKPLVESYQRAFGNEPVLDPVPEFMFSRAKTITAEDYRAAVSLKSKFTEDISREFFGADSDLESNSGSCSDSILIYNTGMGGSPSYRVESYNSLPGATDSQIVFKPGVGVRLTENIHYLASMGGLAEVTLPLDQVEYYSYVSQEWEVLPVSVQLVAGRGCDEMLIELVRELGKRGVLKKVMSGRAAFEQVMV